MNVRAISCRFAARRLTLKASGLLFDHAALLPDRASAVTLVHAVPATPPSCSRKCSSSRGTWPTCSMTSAITMNSVPGTNMWSSTLPAIRRQRRLGAACRISNCSRRVTSVGLGARKLRAASSHGASMRADSSSFQPVRLPVQRQYQAVPNEFAPISAMQPSGSWRGFEASQFFYEDACYAVELCVWHEAGP